jgi:predicted transcriptional regulator of viral defense system
MSADQITRKARNLLATMEAQGPMDRLKRLDYLLMAARKPETEEVIFRAREIVRNGV